jgi:hypothetical protein
LSSELNIQKLSKLSQLASVSITDNGPLADTVKSIKDDNSLMRSAQKLTIQLLPPRLSAVLTHLDAPAPPIARSQSSRSILSGFRQNKIAPAFKNIRNQDNKLRNMPNNRNNYARRISNGEYIVTHPYQTQVIPKEEKTRFIPLAPPHKPNQLWWHPSQPSIVNRPPTRHPVFNINSFRESQRRVNYYGHHPPMTNNLKAPPSYTSDSYPARPVQLPNYKDSKLISSFDLLHAQPQVASGQTVEYKQKVPGAPNNIHVDRDRKQSGDLYQTSQELHPTTLSTNFNYHPTIKNFAVNITEEMIEKNLERINTLERAATHIQQPFIPSLNISNHRPDTLKSESPNSPASGVISLVINLENVTFSNFAALKKPVGGGADLNILNKGNVEEATPPVISPETKTLLRPLDSSNRGEAELRTMPASSLEIRREKEKATLTTNNVPTSLPPLNTYVPFKTISATPSDKVKVSSLNSKRFDILPISSDLPIPPLNEMTKQKSPSEENPKTTF